MNNLIKNVFLGFFAIASFAAAPAMAKNVVADVDQISEVLKAAGYRAEIKEDGSGGGGRYVRSAAAGYNFLILPGGCDDSNKNCKSVQFYVAFNPEKSPTLDAMNTYNKEHRWGRAYLDKDGDPAIEFDLDLEAGGMSAELFLDNVAYWEMAIGRYAKFVFAKN